MSAKVKERALTRDCPACPHMASGRAAQRASAVLGKRADYFCLVRPGIEAISVSLAMRRGLRLRACHLNHRNHAEGLVTLRRLEALSGLSPVPFEGEEDGGRCALCHEPWPHTHTADQLAEWTARGGAIGAS